MNELIFEFIIPLILFTFLIFAILKRIKLSENDKINLIISFSLSTIGTYSLYQLKLSSFLISLSGIFAVAILISLLLITMLKKSFEKIKEEFEKKGK
jgi:hypothetical protein